MDASSILDLLAPLERRATAVSYLVSRSLRSPDPARVVVPAYHLSGPAGGGDRIRIGIFAAIHGDEPASALGAIHFAEQVCDQPELARGYELSIYPLCNPSGFAVGTRHSASGKDLNREFWTGSSEPEVQLLEAEIRTRQFHGLISLHSDDTSNGVYGFVRGAVLTRALLVPALQAAARFLPRNTDTTIDGFPAQDGIISRCYEGVLCSPPDMRLDPEPFEIILETPHAAPADLQDSAIQAALRVILAEYQSFLAFATNL
jgi:hypothetical protein